MTDRELLHEYLEYTSDTAFVELVRRHLDFVYLTCRRDVDSDSTARDAAQDVFSLLAHKAGSIDENRALVDWLFERSRVMAKNALVRELRDSPGIRGPQPDPSDLSGALNPIVNNALDALSEMDREALLLRCCQRRPLFDAGEEMGVSEDTARTRVSRALTSMRGWLERKGVSIDEARLDKYLHEAYRATAVPMTAQVVAETALGAKAAAATPARFSTATPQPRKSYAPIAAAVSTMIVIIGIGGLALSLSHATRPEKTVSSIPPPPPIAPPPGQIPASTAETPVNTEAAATNSATSSAAPSAQPVVIPPRKPSEPAVSGGKSEAPDVPTDSNGLIVGGPAGETSHADQPPANTSAPPPERVLGIVTGNAPSAVMTVNGQERIVRVGSDIGDGAVSEIAPDHVTIANPDGTSRTVPLTPDR